MVVRHELLLVVRAPAPALVLGAGSVSASAPPLAPGLVLLSVPVALLVALAPTPILVVSVDSVVSLG